MHPTIKAIEDEQLRKDAPHFRIGDSVKVSVKVDEGDKTRTQLFEGVVIKKQGSGVRENFTVRRISFGEGVDERVIEELVTDEISIGDYIVTGGELPTMVTVDSVVRLLRGVLGSEESKEFETFSQNLLEYPQYTRPAVYRGLKVPKVLLSGDHQAIEQWRRKEAVKRTLKRRPDLLKKSKKFSVQKTEDR